MIDTDTNTKPNYLRSLIEWVQQVAADQSLPPLAVRVACILTRYVNTRSFEAWPAQPTIAKGLGVTPRGVRAAVSDLIAHGHLTVAVGGGRGISNRYRPTLKTRNVSSGLEAQETRKSRAENPEQTRPKTRNGCSSELIEYSIEELIEPLAAKAAAKGGEREDDLPLGGGAGLPAPPPMKVKKDKRGDRATAEAAFEAFWRQYPKRQGEDGARRAFREVVAADADPQAIVAGAIRYAASVAGKTNRFIAMPAGWLRDGRWKDAPSPPAPHEPARPRRADKEQAISNIFAMAARLKSEGR
jgi:hypothetical protein